MQTNPLKNGFDYHKNFNPIDTVYWTTKNLKITRLRLLSDPGFPFWDVSYCHGELYGKDVRVSLPFHQLPKGCGSISKEIIAHAKRDKLYAAKTGIFSAISCHN